MSDQDAGQQGNGGYLSKEQILAADDLPYEDVNVPEWGGVVRVRGLTGSERGWWESQLSEVTPEEDEGGDTRMKMAFHMERMRVTLCTLCLVDAHGARLFKENEVRALGQKSALALNRVYDVAARISGISKEAVERAAKLSGGTDESGTVSASA